MSKETIKDNRISNKPKIGIGTVNVFGGDTALLPLLAPIGYYTKVARDSGADGIELWPTRGIQWLQLRKGAITQNTKDGILSGHQSTAGIFKGLDGNTDSLKKFRSEVKTLGYITVAGIWTFFPQSDESIDYLQRLQLHTGNIPLVMFTESKTDTTKIKSKTSQLTPTSYKYGGYNSLDEYLEDLNSKDIGYCIDTHHFRRNSQNTPFEDWKKALQTVLDRTKKAKKGLHVHVSVGRYDNNDKNIDTLKEQQDLRDAKYNGNLFEMLDMISKSQTANLYIIETPYPSIKKASGASFTSRKVFVEEFSRMVGSLRNFLEK